MREDPSAVQVQGQLALTLLAVDPVGLGGLHLRSRAGHGNGPSLTLGLRSERPAIQ